MLDILNILSEIGSDSKRTHKLSVIRQHKDNELFKRVLNAALNPYVQYYIRKIPEYSHVSTIYTLDQALDELQKLSKRELTGHAGINHLTHILCSVHPNDAIVIERIIGKDLRCGTADSTVNAIIPEFIPTYPCLLARPYDEKNIKNISYPAIAQLKADGLRTIIQVENDNVSVFGRSGREIELYGHLDNHFEQLRNYYGEDCVFDGELVVVDAEGNIADRKIGNGILNKAIKGTISPEEARLVRVQVWDVIPALEFKSRKSKEIYKVRFEKLKSIMSQNSWETYKSWIIEHKEVTSLDQAADYFNELLQRGEEGIILKDWKHLWEDTRSKYLIKFKAERMCDLEIIGYNPGKGQFESQVGSLICASSDRKVQVDISGFSEDLRLEITRTINQLIGTIVEVLYNERISSKSSNRAGVDSLFLPRFSRFRHPEKLIADASNEIK